MRGIDMISVAIESVNWTCLMQISVICGVILTAFQMQTAEKLETVAEYSSRHGHWSAMRRVSNSLLMLAMLWCASYGYERGWQPWPPFVIVMMALDFNIVVRIMIMRRDIRDHLAGVREVRYATGIVSR